MKTPPTHTSRNSETEPPFFVNEGGDLSLSGPAHIELLRAVLDKGVPFRFQAKGFSMSPFIKDGDAITLSPLSEVSPRSGDVVAFVVRGAKRLVVHRVVGKKGRNFLVKGDRNLDTDDMVAEKDMMGLVTKVERNRKEVFLGLGPERFLIAFLTRRSLLFPLLSPVWRVVRPIVRRLAL